jgi:hypothetical protein
VIEGADTALSGAGGGEADHLRRFVRVQLLEMPSRPHFASWRRILNPAWMAALLGRVARIGLSH